MAGKFVTFTGKDGKHYFSLKAGNGEITGDTPRLGVTTITVDDVEEIVESHIEQGRIVEQGTHDELLELGGTYALFWHRQSGGFIGLDPDDAPEAAE